MYNRLIDFIEKRNIFYNKQFGFRPKHSTDHAILSIIDKIQKAIDERDYSCGIFLDLSKAFDTVNHQILINKLKHYGIRGVAINWLISYLSNRKQLVSIGNVTSDQEIISCGVPQGSVLGPLLFLLYINDFDQCSDLLDFHLFADDANLFFKHKNLITLQSDLNNELNNIFTWLCANKLSLNIDQSNFVIFHPPQKKIPFNVNLFINNKELNHEFRNSN
jgi:retron-type reverse transcriptase